MTAERTQIVVLGAGYAGLMAAMRLAKKTDSRAVAITLVNASETFNERVRNHSSSAAKIFRSARWSRCWRRPGFDSSMGLCSSSNLRDTP